MPAMCFQTPRHMSQTPVWVKPLLQLLAPEAPGWPQAEKPGADPRAPVSRLGMCCLASLVIKLGVGGTGRRTMVKAAKNSHLLFPQIFLGIRQTLEKRLHEIHRHSDGYRETERAFYTESQYQCEPLAALCDQFSGFLSIFQVEIMRKRDIQISFTVWVAPRS